MPVLAQVHWPKKAGQKFLVLGVGLPWIRGVWCIHWIPYCTQELVTTSRAMWRTWQRLAVAKKQLSCGPQLWRCSTFQCRRSRYWKDLWDLWPRSSVQMRLAPDAVSGVEDTAFLGWVPGHVRQPYLEKEPPLLKLGPNGQPVNPSLIGCNWQCMTADSGGRISSHRSGQKCFHVLPGILAVHRWARCTRHGVPGSWVLPCGLTLSQCQLLLGQRHWLGTGAEHTGPCCFGWMLTRTCCCQEPASNVVKLPAMCVGTAWRQSVTHALMRPEQPVVLSWGRSHAAWKWLQGKESGAQPHLFDQDSPGEKLPKPSCNSSPLAEFWLVVSMAAWGLWMVSRQPILCAGDEVARSSTSASSAGRCDRPAGAVGEEGWSPVTAMDLLNANRVAAWRDEAGMQEDSDFGYRWSSYEQAVADAGHTVARAWLTVRAEQDKLLWPAADLMVESLPKPVPSKSPRFQEPIRRKAHWGLKRKGARLRRNTVESPDAINNRVQALTRVFASLGAIRPRGAMSSRLYEDPAAGTTLSHPGRVSHDPQCHQDGWRALGLYQSS